MHDQMLESNRDDVKLEAMRCVTVMIAKGRLSVPRTLFPHIVKNVSSKNPELKKLIYLYLTNFADQEPDLALLPVATLQKSLKSPNPLIRSSALKVLTSMRLSILSAILMATLRNSVNDLSPYVRKTVAHSIIKIYRLEPDLRGDLIEYIERLLNDKNSMVLSSAVASFEVVCPEKLELVHKHYRRFCFILADCSEWGQALFLNLLTRYVLSTYERIKGGDINDYIPSEHDPKILLRSAKPLVHSNNSAVVMAVIKLYIAIANHNEVRSTIARPLIRLLYTHREIQLTVLNMIETLTSLKEASVSLEERERDEEGEGCKSVSLIERGGDVDEDESTIIKGREKDEEVDKPNSSKAGKEEDREEDKVDDEDADDKNDRSSAASEVENHDNEDDEDEGEDEEDDSEDDDDEEEEDDDDDEDYEDEEEESEEDVKQVVVRSDKEELSIINLYRDLVDTNKDPGAYREVFRPYLKSFFVKNNDCTQVRLAKLNILANLSSSVNVTQILRELQAYISIYVEDREFVSAAIQAIGRCAIIVKEVAHICLNRLTSLLSNNNEHIVSEAIVVLRSQIINKRHTGSNGDKLNSIKSTEETKSSEERGTENELDESDRDEQYNSLEKDDKIVSTVIKQVTKLLPTVTAPQARATILWILAEFCDTNLTAAKCAPNVLRSIAKSFCQEDNFVKLQSLTLAAKFLLSLDKTKKAELYHKVHLMTGYLFGLAKYDINHDVRDRGRFLKKLLDDEELCSRVLNCKGPLPVVTVVAIETV